MSESNEDINTQVDILDKEYAAETSWVGDMLGVLAGLTYYLKKYPYACFPVDMYESPQKYRINPFIEYNCYDKNGNPQIKAYATAEEAINCIRSISVPDELLTKFRNCKANSNVRFIIGLIRITYYYPTYNGHTNAFIYDKEDNSVEIFEPHGTRPATKFNSAHYEKTLEDFFKIELGVSNVFTDFCPAVSFQSLQVNEGSQLETDPFGFCQTWALWWIEYRLANAKSKASRKQLIDSALSLLQKKPNYLTTFIRNYAEFVLKQRNIIMSDIFERLQKSDEGQQIIKQLVDQHKLENKVRYLAVKDPQLADELEKQIKPLSPMVHHELRRYLIEEFQHAIDNSSLPPTEKK